MTFNPLKISRKGEAMWWIIIGAVLALIVLIVMVVMFTDKGNNITKGFDSCTGICTAGGTNEKNCPVGTQSSSAFTCQTGGSCCIGFAKECSTSDSERPKCDDKTQDCVPVGQSAPKQYCVDKPN